MNRSLDVSHPGQCMALEEEEEAVCCWGQQEELLTEGTLGSWTSMPPTEEEPKAHLHLPPLSLLFLLHEWGIVKTLTLGMCTMWSVQCSHRTCCCGMIMTFLRPQYSQNIVLPRTKHAPSNAEAWPRDFFSLVSSFPTQRQHKILPSKPVSSVTLK